MKRFGLFVLVLWICFVIFGSWYPFAFQYHDLHEAWYYWLHSGESDKSKTDMFVNFVVGIPTGVLWSGAVANAVIWAFVFGGASALVINHRAIVGR